MVNAAFDSIMARLYGYNVWDGFSPDIALVDHQGWNGNHPSLTRLASSGSGSTVIDVGVWKGQSTINMAKSMKDRGIAGCVIAVDTFLGSPEHWRHQNNLFQRRFGMPNIFDIFMNNVYEAGVSDYIIPMPQTSVTAALVMQKMGIKAQIVHVDAAHEYEEVLRDALEYWKLLQDNGYLIGDDYSDGWPGVKRASHEFADLVKRPISIERPKWIIRKTP